MGSSKNLVLGGSGTIGTELCNQLNKAGEIVINLDLKSGFDLRKDNLIKYSNVDYVWFLAWDVGGAKYLNNPNNFFNILNNNTLISQRTFSFLKAYSIPFMFTSTQLAAADNVYGLTKLMGEEWTKLLNGQLVKLWNVYGWEDPGEKSHVITDFVLKGLTDKEIRLVTDGQEERQFIFMKDCVKNMLAIRKRGDTDVDLTNNEWVKIIDIARLVGRQLDVPVFQGTKAGYNNKITAKLNRQLQFETTLEKGVEAIIHEAKRYLFSKGQ